MRKILLTGLIMLFLVACSPLDTTTDNTEAQAGGGVPDAIGYWSLDNSDTSGGEAIDTINGNNYTNIGIDTGATGFINEAYSEPTGSNGDELNITAGTVPSEYPTGSSDRTFSFWTKMDDLSPSTTYEWGGWGTENDDQEFALFYDGDSVRFRGFANDHDSNVDMNTGSWFMLTVKYRESDKRLVIYRNKSTILNKTLTTALNTGTTNAKFFNRIDGSFSRSLKGDMDEIKIWDQYLTDAQIATVYDNEVNGTQYPYTTEASPTVENLTRTQPSASGTVRSFEDIEYTVDVGADPNGDNYNVDGNHSRNGVVIKSEERNTQSGGNTYTFTLNNSKSGKNVTAGDTYNLTVTATDTNGDSNTASDSFTVNALINVSFTDGDGNNINGTVIVLNQSNNQSILDFKAVNGAGSVNVTWKENVTIDGRPDDTSLDGDSDPQIEVR